MDTRRSPDHSGATTRSGSAAVEMALLLPVLGYISMLAVDYARIIPAAVTIADCARNAALYESDPNFMESTPYTSMEDAALAGAGELEPPPTVHPPIEGTDTLGIAYVEVTVSYTFRTIAGYPGIPKTVELSRTVRMPKVPD